MKHLDFWNNPLVVSALRLKYRRGSPGAVTTLYLIALVLVGAMMQKYWSDPSVPWVRVYLAAIVTLQFIISAFYALVAVSGSLQAEVNQRTLDFQRIAALSPRQILFGKLLGESTGGYILAISTIPLAIWAALAGAARIEVVLLLYLQLTTLTLMFGAIGLVQPLEPATGKTAAGNRPRGLAVSVVIFSFMLLPQLVRSANLSQIHPLLALVIGGLTPIVSVIGLVQGTPWKGHLLLYGFEVPCLLIAPVAQLGVAWLMFAAMGRRLINPVLPLLRKRSAYLAILAIDILVAGVLYNPLPRAVPFDELTATFAGIHLIAGCALLAAATPTKPALVSWLWRFRWQESPLAASAWGDRGEISAAAGITVLLGWLAWLALIWGPARWIGSAPSIGQLDAVTIKVLCAMTLLIPALTIGYQWFVLIAPRSGALAFALSVAMLALVPGSLGLYYKNEWLAGASLATHIGRWLGRSEPPPFAPLLTIYGLLLMAAWIALRRRMATHRARVDDRLREMGDVQCAFKMPLLTQ